MRVDQTVSHIAQADIGSFLKATDPRAPAKGAITVNGNTYNISVDKKGIVKVSFAKTGFWSFNWFRRDALNRMKVAMQEQYDDLCCRYDKLVKLPRTEIDMQSEIVDRGGTRLSPAMQEVRRQTEIAAEGELGEDAGGRTVALYGFDNTRKNAAGKLAERNARVVTINDYIAQSDTCTLNRNRVAVTLPAFVEKVRSGKLGKRISIDVLDPNKDTVLTDEELRKWANFLQRNADKVDVFAKIRSYGDASRSPEHRNATGWVGEAARRGSGAALRSLVAKNLSEHCLKSRQLNHALNTKDLGAIVLVLETLAAYDGDGDPINHDGDFNQLVYECLVSEGINYGEEEARELAPFIEKAVNNVLGNMLTRQLSKLGLDFFREENIPVMFQWSTNDGISLEGAENEIREDKWWKKGGFSIHDRHDDPIMFSTMRHAMKIQAAAGGMPSGITKIKGLGFDPRAGHAAPQGPGAINLDVAKYGAQFRAFVDFASGQRNQDTIARIEGEGHRLQGPDGAPRNIVVKEGDGLKRMSRSQNDKDVNDNVRALFRRTVLAVCGAESVDELPEAVRDAMKTDDHGHGKPLTARRINAVHDAIMSLVQPEEHPELAKANAAFRAIVDSLVGVGEEDVILENAPLPEYDCAVAARKLVNLAKDDPDLLRLLTENNCAPARRILRKDDNHLCSDEEMSRRFDALRDNVNELRTAANGNARSFDAAIDALANKCGKILQKGEIAKMFAAAAELDMAPIVAKKGSKSVGDLVDALCRLHVMVARIGAKSSLCSGIGADSDGRNKAFLMAISAIISRMDEDTIRWLREGICSVKSANIYHTIMAIFLDKQEDDKTVGLAFAVASDMRESMMLAMNAALHLGDGDIPPPKNCEPLSEADIAQVRQIIRDYAESTEEIRPDM